MVKTHRALAALAAVLCLTVTLPAQTTTGYTKYIPAETEAVIQLNFKQMFGAAMLKDLMAAAKAGIGAQGAALKELGFDPFTDLNHVIVAIPGGGNVEKAVVLIQGKFNVAKIEAAAEQAGKADLKVHKIGSTKVFETKMDVPQVGQQSLFVGFLDGTTIAVANTKESISETIDRKDGKTKGALKKEMADLLGKMDAKMTMGMAVLGTVAGQAEVSDRVNSITGGITLADDAKADFVIAAKNADTAKELEALIGMGLDQAKQILPLLVAQQKQLMPLVDLIAVIKVSSTGTNVNIKGQLSKEDIEKALKKAGQ